MWIFSQMIPLLSLFWNHFVISYIVFVSFLLFNCLRHGILDSSQKSVTLGTILYSSKSFNFFTNYPILHKIAKIRMRPNLLSPKRFRTIETSCDRFHNIILISFIDTKIHIRKECGFILWLHIKKHLKVDVQQTDHL